MVFLINLLNVSEEAVVQVVMDKILDVNTSIPLSEEAISNIVEYKDRSLKCADNLDPKIQGLINEIVSKDSTVIIIPVLAMERRGKCILNTLNTAPICKKKLFPFQLKNPKSQ